MAASTAKEKAVEKTLQRLEPTLQRKLNGFDVCVELYGYGQLTYTEYEGIKNQREVFEANKKLLSAIHRRGPDILDALIDALSEEADANKHIIDKIKDEYKKNFADTSLFEKQGKTYRGMPVMQEETQKEFLGNGSWPASLTASSAPVDTLSSVDATDFNPKMVYKMTTKPRGVAIIINNRLFTCGMRERIGTDKDADSLTRLFIHMGFYTNRYDNLTGSEIHKRLEEVARLNHSKYDCLIVCVLTHGISGRLYSTDGVLIPVEDLTKYFDGVHCPLLIGKPKLFILQACRGGKFDYGVESETTDFGGERNIDAPSGPEPELSEDLWQKVYNKALDEKEFEFVDGRKKNKDVTEEVDGGPGGAQALPVEADFVLAYATVPGYVSWRNSEYGSWFIKAFVDTMFERISSEHFMDILIEVNHKVANNFQSKGRNKQIPAPVTMLTKKLYFRPGKYS